GRHALHGPQPQHVRELGLLLTDALLGSLTLDHRRAQPLDGGSELLRALVHPTLELVMRALQGLLGAHALGDVDGEHDDPDDLAILAAIRDLVGADPALLSGSSGQDLDDAQTTASGEKR